MKQELVDEEIQTSAELCPRKPEGLKGVTKIRCML